MKIQKINIKNFKGIANFEGEVKGGNVYLIGGNATGKTSFIDAVWCGVTGKNIPAEPTTDGAKKGLIEIDLGDFIARTKFTKGKPIRFELENKSFNKESEKFIKSPRSFLESKIGMINFNIDDFFAKSPAEQVKYFAKIMGVDFSDIDSEIEENVESRKFDKRRLKVLKETSDYFDPKDAKKELIVISKLSEELIKINDKEVEFKRIEQGIQNRENKISEINDKILELQNELIGLNHQVNGGKDWLKNAENIPDLERAVAISEEMKNAETINDTIRTAKILQATDAEITNLESYITKNTENIDKLREDKAARISEKINVHNLEYSIKDECFLYDGLPFEKNQINTAAQLIAGMKIASTMLKDLKILRVDASLIDKSNFDEVLEWADAENIGLFIELVNRESTKLEIHLDVD